MKSEKEIEEMLKAQFSLDGNTEDVWAYILHQIVQSHLSLLECIRSAEFIRDQPENPNDYVCASTFLELAKEVFFDLTDLKDQLGSLLGTVGVIPSEG